MTTRGNTLLLDVTMPNATSYKPKISLIETIECPKVGFLYSLGFRLCRKLSARHRRMIVLTSLAARLMGVQQLGRYQRMQLAVLLNIQCNPSAIKLPMLLSKRIWPHVAALNVLDIKQDDRLVRRVVGRLPMWFLYGGLDQRLRDVSTVLQFCRSHT